jgi:hypothetical protein
MIFNWIPLASQPLHQFFTFSPQLTDNLDTEVRECSAKWYHFNNKL